MESFIYFILGLIASLIINLATPPIQKILEGRSLVSKNKKLKSLQEELIYFTMLENNTNKFLATIFGDFLVLGGLIAFMIFTTLLTFILVAVSLHMLNFNAYKFMGIYLGSRDQVIGFSVNLLALSQIMLIGEAIILAFITKTTVDTSRKVRNIRQFDRYKSEMQERINQLNQVSGESAKNRLD